VPDEIFWLQYPLRHLSLVTNAVPYYPYFGCFELHCVQSRLWWNWQTRYFEVVVPQGVQVQILLSAPFFNPGPGSLSEFPMKVKLLLIVCALGLAAGCRTRYELTLNNAVTITSVGKPKLDRGFYTFKDAVSGQKVTIPSGRVIQIEALPLWGKKEEDFKSPTRN